ncbi:hypothetical protein BH18THE2_BH18THE2_43660 [soil metagenome]
MCKNPLQKRRSHARSLGSFFHKFNVLYVQFCGPATLACNSCFAFSSDNFFIDIATLIASNNVRLFNQS